MIQADKLSRHFGAVVAVENLSFKVHRGEIMGLLGPNGAGKSTTMKMLTCFLPPTSGHATVCGIPLDSDGIGIRRKIGYLPENAPSYSELDTRTHLDFIGRMLGLPAGTRRERIDTMSRSCGIESVLNRRIDELSKGFRQRVGLAACMLHDPPCLILDEPTSGLDPNQIVQMRHLIRRLGEEKTVVLSSHVLSEVEATCDRMLIIDKGRLVAMGTVNELAGQAHGGSSLFVLLKGDVNEVIQRLHKRFPDLQSETEQQESGTGLRISCGETGNLLAEMTFRAAVESGAVILEMHRIRASLEDIFRKLTGEK